MVMMMPPRSLAAEDGKHRLHEAALDALAIAVIVIDQDKRVVYSNRAAADLLRPADGLALVNGRLEVALSAERNLLHRLLDQALAPMAACGGLMHISRSSEGRPYVVHTSPIPPPAECQNQHRPALAMIVVSTPETHSVEPEAILASLYELTPAQARLARGLLDGETLETLSRRASVSRNTLRAHLVQLFAKTDTHRQAELVCRLMRDLQMIPLVRCHSVAPETSTSISRSRSRVIHSSMARELANGLTDQRRMRTG